jgi:hypothetical protein
LTPTSDTLGIIRELPATYIPLAFGDYSAMVNAQETDIWEKVDAFPGLSGGGYKINLKGAMVMPKLTVPFTFTPSAAGTYEIYTLISDQMTTDTRFKVWVDGVALENVTIKTESNLAGTKQLIGTAKLSAGPHKISVEVTAPTKEYLDDVWIACDAFILGFVKPQ